MSYIYINLHAIMQTMETTGNTKVLANGAIYDLDRKRIVANPGGGTAAITSANASEYHAKRMELKRQALAAGARKALEAQGRVISGDLDFVEAIGEALIVSATDPDNRQQVRAAEMLIRETGLSERQDTAPAVTGGQAADIIASLAQFAATIAAVTATQPPEQPIDGDIVPPELPNHSN